MSAYVEFQNNFTFTAGILGLFIAAPLITLHRQRFANIYLGMFLVSFSLLSLAGTDIYRSNPQLFGLLDWPLSCLGAFFYLYVRGMCGHKSTKKDLLHFIPLLVYSLILLYIRLLDRQDTHIVYIRFDLPFFQIVTLVYAVAILFLLKKYRLAVHNNYSSDKNRDLNWLSWLSFTIISLLIIWIPATIFLGIWLVMLDLGRLLILFFVGWYGLRQNCVFIEQNTTPQTPAIIEPSYEDKYKRSGMKKAIRNNIELQLQE